MKFLGENFVVLNLQDMTSQIVTKDFLDTTKVPFIKEQIDKLDAIKSKTSAFQNTPLVE